MIRHSGLNAAAVPSLAIAMIEPSFGALLVPPIGTAALVEPRTLPTDQTTVALAAITAGAQKEFGAAFAVPANAPSEGIVRRRHAP
jgi:hypothetical protein